ncbi:hypothetical protein EDD85DRAFT_779102 [Armillaria nabsnona]|nr:hypothetical protein EDD85DRAFT_779102 [Armillaria nabsnona]
MATAPATPTAKTVVRREDLHTLAEVVAEADDIALNTSGIYGITKALPLEISSSSRKDSSGLKVEVEEVKQQVISLLDRLDISEKQSDVRQKQLLEAFQQAKNTGPQQSNSCNNESRSASANNVCWYDRKLGHFAKDCEQTKKHIVEGLLKIVNDKIIMSDGNLVPSQPAQKALFERVIEYFAKRNTGQLLFEDIDNIAGIYQLSAPLNSEVNSVYTNRVVDNRDDIINKLRRDVQQLQQNNNQASQQVHHPVNQNSNSNSFNMNTFMNQMMGLMNQLSNSNGSNAQQPAENSQFVATQTGAGTNQPDF